jgi:hypothetical protein
MANGSFPPPGIGIPELSQYSAAANVPNDGSHVISPQHRSPSSRTTLICASSFRYGIYCFFGIVDCLSTPVLGMMTAHLSIYMDGKD